jgi:hypothetical protein
VVEGGRGVSVSGGAVVVGVGVSMFVGAAEGGSGVSVSGSRVAVDPVTGIVLAGGAMVGAGSGVPHAAASIRTAATVAVARKSILFIASLSSSPLGDMPCRVPVPAAPYLLVRTTRHARQPFTHLYHLCVLTPAGISCIIPENIPSSYCTLGAASQLTAGRDGKDARAPNSGYQSLSPPGGSFFGPVYRKRKGTNNEGSSHQ